MKKILIALMACAAIVSCSKSDVIYENEMSEVTFTPVAQNSTKSVAGYTDNGFDGMFPTTVELYVFANAVEGTYAADNAGATYFTNAKFKYNEDKGEEDTQLPNETPGTATAGAYEGDPTRYWPNVKTLVFAGYSDACGVNKTTPTMDFAANTLTIPSYTQDNTTYTEEGANDLMWFPCDGSSYSKAGNEVPAKMQHACSWITVKVKSGGQYSNVKLHNLTINGLYHTGTATCGASAATWETSGNAENEVLFSNEAGKDVATNEEIYENTTNNFIVIPQTPTTIDVTYSFVPQEGVTAITETVTALPLTYATTDGTSQKWESGKHYIYTITINATEILIDPYVVQWEDNTNIPEISTDTEN